MESWRQQQRKGPTMAHYSDSDFDTLCSAANNLGYDHGLESVENGTVSEAPLSGEYADDMTPSRLFEAIGADEAMLSDIEQSIVCEDYESGYFAAANGN